MAPLKAPELFSCLFYVAASRLNSPRFSFVLIRFGKCECQEEHPQIRLPEGCNRRTSERKRTPQRRCFIFGWPVDEIEVDT